MNKANIHNVGGGYCRIAKLISQLPLLSFLSYEKKKITYLYKSLLIEFWFFVSAATWTVI